MPRVLVGMTAATLLETQNRAVERGNCPDCGHRLVWHFDYGCTGRQWVSEAGGLSETCRCTTATACLGGEHAPITTGGEYEVENTDCGCAAKGERFHFAGFCAVCRVWQHTEYRGGGRILTTVPHVHSRPWSDVPQEGGK